MARRHWLFKSEPGSFSIDDLAACPGGTDSWDGVRNYQARNFIRDEIKNGDGVLFYHSSAKTVGIAGICEVVSDPYPDDTARDPESKYFDPKSSHDNPRWYLVDVRFKKRLTKLISLTELKDTPGLESMVLCKKGSRLSIQPVKPDEWKIILKLAGSTK